MDLKEAFEKITAEKKTAEKIIAEKITAEKITAEMKTETSVKCLDALDYQIEKSAKSVVIKGVPMKKSMKNETLLDLKEVFEEITAEMNIETDLKCMDAYRLIAKGARENANEPPPLKIELESKIQRMIFFKNLKKLKKFKNIKVTADVPKPLLPQYRSLEKTAFDLRKAEEGTKTMLVIQNQAYTLLVKKPNEQKFSLVI